MDQVGSIGTWTRDQLEDQYLRLYDDYLTLKKHACKQEERIKKMATRLLRLASDKKYIEAHPVVEEEYKEQIANLQKRNAQLTQQLQLAKNHLKLQKFSFRSSPSLSRPLSGANIRTLVSTSKEEKERDISATGALQTARMQNAALEQTIRHLSEQIRQKEQSIGQLKEDMLLKETAHQKDLEELIRQLTNKQRDHLKENLCLIRNQREIREKQSRITTLEARLHESETDNESTKEANRKLISEVERLTHEVGQLEQQLAEMQSKCHVLSKDQLKVMQLQCTIDDLKRENKVLKEANGKLMTKALPSLSDQNWVQQEKKLRSRITHLESLLQERMGPPTNREKAETVLCESLTRVLSAPSEKSKQDSNLLNIVGDEATSSFNQAAGFTQQDLDEALALLREQKTQKSIAATGLESMDHGTSREEDITKQLHESEIAHADTIRELEKTRKLLAIQYGISKEGKAEAAELTERLAQVKEEADRRLAEYAKLLDIRADRIRNLESRIQEVTYGRKMIKGTTEELAEAGHITPDQCTPQPGENQIEIHIGILTLTSAAPMQFANSRFVEEGTNQPKLFVTWDFYDFETQTTAIVQGVTTDFDLTVQYPVQMDDFLLSYLHWGRCAVELHECTAYGYRTIAVGELDLTSLLENKTESNLAVTTNETVVHRSGRAELVEVAGTGAFVYQQDTVGRSVGQLEYWIRLSVPTPRAINLYKVRYRSLRKLQTEGKHPPPFAITKKGNLPDNYLKIQVLSIRDLRGRYPERKPSPYFVFQFYDNPEYVSETIEDTCNATFKDVATFPLRLTQQLDEYMRTQSLKIYVVDSADQDDSSCCLGVCKIPLLGLVDPARGQVDGVFEIIPLNEEPDSKKQFGTMNVRLFWSKPYNQSFTPHPEKRFVSSKENWNGHAEGTKQQPDTLANSGNSIEESICSEHKSNVSESGAVHITCPVRSSAIEKAGNQMDTEAMEIFIQLATEELELPGLADEEWTSTTPRPNVISYGASTEPTQKKKSNKAIAKQPCKSPLGSSKSVEMVDSSGTTSFSASVFEETNCSANAVGKNYYGARKLEQKGNDRTDGMPTPLPRHRDHGGQKGSRSGDKNATSDFRQSRVRHSTSSKKMDEDSVMNTKGRTIAKCSEIDENHVRIRLHRVEFAELPDQMKNNEYDKIFVEYFFLGSPEPFETPSAPLLALNTDLGATIFVAELEYEKSFSVDPAENFERRQHLATYLWSQDPNSDKLAFTIVTDPAVTQAAECEEVGVARVTIRDILTAKRDMEHIIIPIFSVDTRHSENNPGEEIGSITVSIHCLAALEAIKKEMPELTVATA